MSKNFLEQIVKSLAEQEQITEKLKATDMMLCVKKMNSIYNWAGEIINEQVIYRREKTTTYRENFVGCA